MSEQTLMDLNSLYKEMQRLIKEYRGPVEFGVVVADGFMNLYTDRGMAFPFMMHATEEGPYTWRSHWLELEDKSSAGFAKFIFDYFLSKSLRSPKQDLLSRKKIIASKQMPKLRLQHPELDDIAIAKYVIYQRVSGQTCTECKLGVIVVEVGSWAEYHECINCGNCRQIQ